jgi:hypothetical protein
MRMATLLLATILAVAAPFAETGAPAIAQSSKPSKVKAVGLKSFAAVQAPEAATEACYGATPKAAQDCAMARCQKKAGKGSCFALTVCAPGGWAGIMGVRVTEVSFADVMCGAPSKEALLAGFEAYCKGHLPQMQECSIGQIWSPDGKMTTIEKSWKASDFKK